MRERNLMSQAALDKNDEAMVLQANQGNLPAAAEPQKGHRRSLHAE